jgi:transcriptional regulator with XRE-family HTH domain
MSDLYLVLRSRLESVTSWVSLGTDVMFRARKAKGLSYEAVARQANVSSKTYERYEKRGRVPEHEVEMFADILGLEIERPARERVTLEPPLAEADALALIGARLESLEAKVQRSVDLTGEALELLREAQLRDAPGRPVRRRANG